ncbi:MAG: alpha/beta fold hydrolase [Micrococcus sp.]|nr:alpha/beta fold hydrolase [Micrococcus sp.]
MKIDAAPAQLPDAAALPGWDPQWSRLMTIASTADPSGLERTLHVGDTGPALAALGVAPVGTILAVHGNPTYSYLWRSIMRATLEAAQAGLAAWRVVAPDQLDMGYSERLEHPELPRAATMGTRGDTYRSLTARIDDMDALVDALHLRELVESGEHELITLGHDWGGVVSLGWAGRHPELISGVVTLNTAIHQPEGTPIPLPLQAALAGPMLPGTTVRTDAFLSVTTSLANPRLEPEVRAAYHAPYPHAAQRGGVGGFVADIPVGPEHGSHATLTAVADSVTRLGQAKTPALILWGADDPVFLDRFLDDLRLRLPAARVHRYEQAGHLLIDDRDLGTPLLAWLHLLRAGQLDEPGSGLPTSVGTADPADDADTPRMWDHLMDWGALESADREYTALVDMAGTGSTRALIRRRHRAVAVSWGELQEKVSAMAAGLWAEGMRPGDRVSMLIPPGRDLTAALYAVLRIGAVAVVADQGLGIAGMTRAVRSARPDWILGQVPGLTVARAQNWPGTRISVSTLPAAQRRLLQVSTSLYALMERHQDARTGPHDAEGQPLPVPERDAEAAVLFTSGSTGPAKGVVYTHARLEQVVARVRAVLGIAPGTSLLAGFAPFALLGPALGATSVAPDMDVTQPATLTAAGLAEAAEAGQSSILFASPAALRNVVATAEDLTAEQRATLARITTALSAGAPVSPQLMRQVATVMPNATLHSPYGMTEGLLLTDIDADTVEQLVAAPDAGVCVGRPVDGVTLRIAPLLPDGTPDEVLLDSQAGHSVLGEVVVSAPHLKERYDALWFTDHQSKRDSLITGDGQVYHRTNDVGHLDAQGQLWIEGRLQHVLTTPQGPLAPGGPEAQVDALPMVSRCAVVGVGPAGTQAVVVVVEPATPATVPPRQPGHTRDGRPEPGVAPSGLARAVRDAVAPLPVAAVLVTHEVPTDIRHNSKIDRTRIAAWAEDVLAGGKVGRI